MTKLALVVAILLALGGFVGLWGRGEKPAAEKKPAPIPWPAGLPVYDHVVIVVEENKDYGQIIDKPQAPYINRLRTEGRFHPDVRRGTQQPGQLLLVVLRKQPDRRLHGRVAEQGDSSPLSAHGRRTWARR